MGWNGSIIPRIGYSAVQNCLHEDCTCDILIQLYHSAYLVHVCAFFNFLVNFWESHPPLNLIENPIGRHIRQTRAHRYCSLLSIIIINTNSPNKPTDFIMLPTPRDFPLCQYGMRINSFLLLTHGCWILSPLQYKVQETLTSRCNCFVHHLCYDYCSQRSISTFALCRHNSTSKEYRILYYPCRYKHI